MKLSTQIRSLLVFLLTGLMCFTFNLNLIAQQTVSRELVSTIKGKLMLVGSGEMSASVGATFAKLAKEETGKLVILTKRGKIKSKNLQPWQKRIGTVKMVHLTKSKTKLTLSDLAGLRASTAVWLEYDFSKYLISSELKSELLAVLQRGGIVGGQGIAAESIATSIDDATGIRDGFNLLPNSYIEATDDGNNHLIKTLEKLPGKVGWHIPTSASVVVHNGRQISVIGYPEITLRVAKNGEWPERVASFGPPVNYLPFTTDLISWNRSGIARLGELFPPRVAPVPEVPNGALLIIGGGGSTQDMWDKMIEFAGGKEAKYVCISQTKRSVGAEKLRGFGCDDVSVYVIGKGMAVDGYDKMLLQDLEKANAVYLGGGRTYKYMDSYLDTPVHQEMNKLLERGGIIVGTSAGAQIVGGFLVRGDPRTNNSLYMEGNDMGLSFIRGVIIDAHFRQRGREKTLPPLLLKYPQMLGIGLDEATAIFIQGNIAEVMGKHEVTFYDLTNTSANDTPLLEVGNPLILSSGEKYDMKDRKKIY